jgi:hypothetical protein
VVLCCCCVCVCGRANKCAHSRVHLHPHTHTLSTGAFNSSPSWLTSLICVLDTTNSPPPPTRHPTPHPPSGKPQNGFVNQSVADQYTFALRPGGVGAEVVLIPLSGDADLYVLVGEGKPNATNYDYRSTAAFGNDVISLNPSDAAYIRGGCGQGCPISIAVQGFQPR